MNPAVRIAVASLSLSAAGMGTLVVDEHYTQKAIIPVPGDRWTVGFGSTFWEDGTPVKEGDTITPVRAITLKLKHISIDEDAVRKCVKAPITQGEYDVLLSHAYQYGHAATCSSTIVKLVNQERYDEACQQYSRWTKVGGKDCRAPDSTCRGVATRADTRVKRCLTAGQGSLTPEEIIKEPIKETIHEPLSFKVDFPKPDQPEEAKEESKRVWPWVVALIALVGSAAFYIYRRKRKHVK